MSSGDWIQALAGFDRRGEACVLVTVTEAAGSTPRTAGTKMLVGADSLHGTIGGGALEFAVIEMARGMLDRRDGEMRTHSLPLGPALGQCCGGRVSVMLEPILPPPLRVLLFGAGHVGRALVTILGTLPARVVWVDNRPDMFPPSLPDNVTALLCDRPAEQVTPHDRFTHILVMTHDHALDYRLVRTALASPGPAFVGLIGSATKRARFFRRLGAEGIDTTRLVCPIGTPAIQGKHPGEIALAVAAQMVAQPVEVTATAKSSIVTNKTACDSCGNSNSCHADSA